MNRPSSSVQPLMRKLLKQISQIEPIWLVLLATIFFSILLSDRFFTTENIINVLHQSVIVGIVAIGMTLVLILGHFDLSTGATLMMAAVLAILLGPTTPGMTVIAILLPIGIGALIGVLNGLIICWLRANSIIATLGMQFAIVGGVLAMVSGAHVRTDGETAFFWSLSNGKLVSIPIPVIIFILLATVASILMHYRVTGRHIYAIGSDLEAARRAGISTTKIGILTFVLSGMFAAVSGILVASRVRHLDPTGITGYEFPALTAAVLGGASLMGGKGRPFDTIAAILTITIVVNIMTLKGFPHSSQLFAQGLILVLAVAYYEFRHREFS